MTEIQTILIIVIVALTILLGIVGLQVFLILRQVRKLVAKISLLVDGKEFLSEISLPGVVKRVFGFLRRK